MTVSTASYDDGGYRAGDVVIAYVRNPLEDAASKGKARPSVLVRRDGGHWTLMGLTSKATFATSGEPRIAVPHPGEVGLRGPGFLWADHLTNVSVLDVGRVIGVIDPSLAELIISTAQLASDDAEALRRAAGGGSDGFDLAG